MSDANEMVTVETSEENRVRLYNDLTRRAYCLFNDARLESLDLGFEFLPSWPNPTSEATEVTFSQLIVLAKKLKMRIRIRELQMTPL